MLKDLIVLICSDLYKLWCFKPFGASVVGELRNQIEPPRLWASPHGAIPRDLPSAAADLKRLGRLWRLWHIYPYLILFCFLVSQLYFNLSTLAYVTRCNKLQEESRYSMVHICLMPLCPYVIYDKYLWIPWGFDSVHCPTCIICISNPKPVSKERMHRLNSCQLRINIITKSALALRILSSILPFTNIYIYIHKSVHIYIYPFIHIYIYTIIQYYTYIVIHRWLVQILHDLHLAMCWKPLCWWPAWWGRWPGSSRATVTMDYGIPNNIYIYLLVYKYRVINNNTNDNNNNKNNTI